MSTTTAVCGDSLEAAKKECLAHAGGGSIPNELTTANDADRAKMCESTACQEYVRMLKIQVAAKCDEAVREAALHIHGILSPGYCTVLVSTKMRTLAAAPNVVSAVDTNSTSAPATQAPVPAPTTATPVPSPAASPPPTARELTPTTTPAQATTPAAEDITIAPQATPAPVPASPVLPPISGETMIPPVVTLPPTPVTAPPPAMDTATPEVTPPAPTTTVAPPTAINPPPPVPPAPTPPPATSLPPSSTTPTPMTPSPPTTTPSSSKTTETTTLPPLLPAPSSASAPKATTSPQPPTVPQTSSSAVTTTTTKPPSQTTVPSITVAQTTKAVNATATTSEDSTRTPAATSTAAETPVVTAIDSPAQAPASTPSTTLSLAESPQSTPSTPKENPSQSDAGFSPIVIAISGGVVLLVVVLAIVLVRIAQTKRRRRTFEYEEDMGSKYQDMSSPRTAAGTTMSVPWAGSVLATSRISLDKLQRGPIISQGGYGEVSRGYYNGQEVAIKRLLVSRRRDLVSIHDFLEEIKLTAMLDHECITKFIGVGWDSPSDLCMVSEYVPGGDLRSLLSRRAREGGARGFDDDKLRIAMQIAHALTYLHTLQPVVVHRDLKSRNVLLTAQLDAKLIDFGVSTERCDVTMTAGVGTSLWMAPEMMLGQRYDEKADVFSFGVVLSELDTHELPYSHMHESPSGRLMNDMVVMQLVSQGQLIPEFSASADPRIVELARDCLQLDGCVYL